MLSTEYCITLDRVPEAFYPEIARNPAQIEEWRRLFKIDEIAPTLVHGGGKAKKAKGKGRRAGLDVAFLKAHPTLVLDTRFFDQDFKDRLLAAFENLDEQTGGLLIHGENFQALGLLLDKYRGQVKCIHIDPPYNTETTGFLYKNNYQHSSWLAMMWDRLDAAAALLEPEGSLLSHADENEYERLKLLVDMIGIPDAGTIVWDKRNPMTAGRGVATQHEYVIWRSAAGKPIYQRNGNMAQMLHQAAEIIAKHGGVTESARREYAEWVRANPRLSGGEKAYCYLDDEGRIYQSVSLRAPEPRTDPKFFEPLIHPVTGKPCAVPRNGFSRTPETLRAMVEAGEIIFGPGETTQPRQKRLLTAETQMRIRSVIQSAKRGKQDVDQLGLEFPYCHAVQFYEELVAAAAPDEGDRILDHFAGSGTTAHAVLNLNAADGGHRRYILVEMAHYFDTVLKPRIEKVMFSRGWRDGKPTSNEGHSHIFKYQRLESYEDALDNIAFNDAAGQRALDLYGGDYLLRYMLGFETRDSETLLSVERLESPFSYTLRVQRDGETREQPVDLPETFNYLIGLHVKTRRIYHDPSASSGQAAGRRYLVYRGSRERSEVVVIWRDTKGWTQADLERDKQFVLEQKLTEGADEVYVNGDSFIPEAQALDPVFKRLMLGGSTSLTTRGAE